MVLALPESSLLEQALSLSVEEQEALADSLISSLGGKVDEGVRAAWDDEIKKRITEDGALEAREAEFMSVALAPVPNLYNGNSRRTYSIAAS